jgi:hypothetical protein
LVTAILPTHAGDGTSSSTPHIATALALNAAQVWTEYPESAGGNDCTFLNILVQLFLPNVFQNVVNITELAYKTAGWGRELNLRPPNTCGLRTSEYLNYDGFKGLGGHSDTGSLYTTLFALTDPKLYKGGEYYIFPMDEPDDRLYYFKPRQYSAVVFLSETFHG